MAQKLGVSFQAIHNYRKNLRVPSKEIMSKIVLVTNRQVMPNDFYKLPNEVKQL